MGESRRATMIELSIVPRRIRIEEGGVARATVTVRSAEPTPRAVAIALDGSAATWCTLDQPSLAITPHGEAQSLITVHPPMGTSVGEHKLEVVATDAAD